MRVLAYIALAAIGIAAGGCGGRSSQGTSATEASAPLTKGQYSEMLKQGNAQVASVESAAPTDTGGGTATEPQPADHTVVTLEGGNFFVNGQVTNPGSPAEGLLMNSRMVQGLFNDSNSSTKNQWSYPGTSSWVAPRDPDRNTDEFV